MKLFHYPDPDRKAGPAPAPCAVALGFFDGVHLGHRALLREAREAADRAGLRLVVLTFPAESGIKARTPRIYGDAEKLLLLEACGADAVMLCDFSAVCGMPPDVFVREVLLGALNARLAVCGFNFRFGKDAAGDAAALEKQMRQAGARTQTIAPVLQNGEPISATRIREALSRGEIRQANEALGAPFFLLGEVRHGKGIGKTIDLPTANTDLPAGCPLARGVYRTAAKVRGKLFFSLTNIGTCPTFGARTLHAETYLEGADGDLYGEIFPIYFLDFLREERTFSSAKELKKQIEVDIMTAKEQSARDPFVRQTEN